ncbi:MAG: NAD-dependent epimerase/dehydratase family protein, partial [Xanthobacteraceae bacterium]
MDFSNRHIVVTGGAGALGTAVVAALLDAGATCRVPCFDEAEAKRFRFAAHKQVETIVAGNLAEEAAVARVFADLPSLWASIHIAGGFAFAALRD